MPINGSFAQAFPQALEAGLRTPVELLLQQTREFVNFQYLIGATIFAMTLCASMCMAQTAPLESAPKTSLLREKSKEGDISAAGSASFRKGESLSGRDSAAVRFHKKQFLILSAAVCAVSLADMYQTMRVRNESWWYERDPLARPIVRLPAPAYYGAGLALATGVNWLSWKMGHSRRWHKLAPLPQLFSIAGNACGFKSNYH